VNTTATSFDYMLPSLGADMDAGRVVEWRVEIGDEVARGDIMAVVETEKSDIDIEIWHGGIVEEFLVDLAVEVPVGTPIARLRPVDGSASSGPTSDSPSVPESSSLIATADPSNGRSVRAEDVPRIVVPVSGDRVPASPLARRTAAERGIDLGSITGSGPNGAVVVGDLDTSLAATTAPSSSEPDRMRTMIAARMAQANRDIPHYHLSHDVDMAALETWLTDRNESRPIAERVLPAAAYVRAVALGAAKHPEINGHWVDDRFVPADAVNVAMAVSLRRGGLLTPNVGDADERSIDEIMAILREHVAGARTGSLKASWMTGSTITITNLGDRGADLVHGVISPPEVALVGMGRVRRRPWVVDGAVAVRPIMTLTLAADHRATDGATGSRFLTMVADLLEHPERLEGDAS
jgi:pyruvate dehydrogenase E2 component (dihydrolipoamide acetyltransferase)